MREIGFVEILAIVGGIAIVLVVFYVVQIARRSRETLSFRFSRAVVALVLYGLGVLILGNSGLPAWEILAFSVLLGLTPLIFMRTPKRSRYYSSGVRQAVIRRDLKGRAIDPRREHLDHIVPFAKGGDHSPENLRVVPKEYNLRRGAKMPGLLDLLGHKPKLRPATGSGELSQESEPRRGVIRRLAAVALLVAAAGFWWHLVQSHRLPNSAPSTSTPGPPASASAPPIAAVPAPAPLTAAMETPPPASPNAADTPAVGTTAGTAIPSVPAPPAGPLPEVPKLPATPELPAAAPTSPPDNTAPAAPSVAPSGDMTPTYTTGELFALYKSDKHAADRLIKGRTIQVIGTIAKVGKDELALREPADRDSVNCKFGREVLQRAKPMARMTVTVKGRVKGRGITGTIHLDGCELIASTAH